MKLSTIAIIGAGNMGKSLLQGLIQNSYPADRIWICDPSPDKLKPLQSLNVNVTTNNLLAVEQADVVVFAVKPQNMASLISSLSELIRAKQPLIISVATGIRESKICEWLQCNIPIVRAMPNTPALICCGATGLHANSFVDSLKRDIAESIMRAVGIVVWLENENQIDIVTALSGSGPAYFFLMMEALQEAGKQLGLAENQARLLTLQTALGAARMAMETEMSLTDLRHQVTSPEGTTERALAILEKHHFQEILHEAVQAAKCRAEELQ